MDSAAVILNEVEGCEERRRVEKKNKTKKPIANG